MSSVVQLRKNDIVGRAIDEMRPADLGDAESAEFDRLCRMLAAKEIDRLKPHYCYAIEEMARCVVRLRELRAYLAEHGDQYEVEGRNGDQKKLHPYVAQVNDERRMLRTFMCALGLSPRDEKGLLTAPSASLDETDEFFNVA